MYRFALGFALGVVTAWLLMRQHITVPMGGQRVQVRLADLDTALAAERLFRGVYHDDT